MAVLFLGYGDGPASAVPHVFTGLCAPVVIAALWESRRSSAASSALSNSLALSCSSSSSLLLRFARKLYFDLLRQQHSKRKARKARKARKERPPMIPPTTAKVCWPLELSGTADEICIMCDEDVLIELVLVVVAVASVPRMEDAEVSDSVLPIEK